MPKNWHLNLSAGFYCVMADAWSCGHGVFESSSLTPVALSRLCRVLCFDRFLGRYCG